LELAFEDRQPLSLPYKVKDGLKPLGVSEEVRGLKTILLA